MKYTALVPVKALSEAKSRLATHLTRHQRENLVLDMLYHVLQVLQESRALDQVSVVSSDHHVLAQARYWGAQALLEAMPGHNAALHAAALHEQEMGASALLTIAADLPLLHPNDIRAMLTQSTAYPVVLASSRDGIGTNAILTHPPLALPYLFGVNSLKHYRHAASQQHLNSTIYSSIGLGLDIDTIDDLDDLYELQILSGEYTQNWQQTTCGTQV